MDINDIINDIVIGTPIIVVDDYDRENEGDIVIAARAANRNNIAFAMRYARGLMCIPCCGKILDRLTIPMMVANSTDPNQTPFTVSVDSIHATTGMSVHDRLKTIRTFTNKNSVGKELTRPGHLFPLRPQENLLADRRGHTEASIELMGLAKVDPVSIIVEIVNDDGTMAKGNDLVKFGEEHDLKTISVEEIYDAVYN